MVTIDQQPNAHDDIERRVHPRATVERPAKIFDPQSGKYHAASTCDLSIGGVLVELTQPITARPGDTLMLGIAETRRQPLLRQSELTRVTVVRTMHANGGGMLLAVRFPHETGFSTTHMRLAA